MSINLDKLLLFPNVLLLSTAVELSLRLLPKQSHGCAA